MATRPIGILIGALALALSGCQNDRQARDGVVTLQFWNGFTGPDGATMDAIVQRFNHEHPKVHVETQVIPWATYYDKVTLGLAFGGAPDVFILQSSRVAEYANYNALLPLDDLIAQSGLKASDFVPTVWSQTGLWQGKRYALPLDCWPLGLYYNVDLFRKAGIERPPKTLDEFVADAKKLTKDTNGDGKPDQWGFAFTNLHSNALTLMNQFGAGLMSADGKRSGLDSSGAYEAMDMMLRFIEKDRICPRPAGIDSWLSLRTGKVAMAMEGVYMMSSLEEQKGLNYAAAPIPQFGPKYAVWAGSHTLAVPANEPPERRQAAWTFMKYLSDHSLDWAKGGQLPARTAILNSPEFRSLRIQREFAKELPYVVYEPNSPATNQIGSFFDPTIEACVNRTDPLAEALKTGARRVDQVIARQ